MQSLHVVYASTSGHTEFVIGVLVAYLKKHAPDLAVTVTRAEEAKPEDLTKGDALLLASGTWNTGGIEGQMNPHMVDLLMDRAKDIDLAGKPVAIIALGDDRYFYTCRANEHLRQFAMQHNGKVIGDALLIVNEPYGQEEKVERWAEKFLIAVSPEVLSPKS
jgi:flavodoxin I